MNVWKRVVPEEGTELLDLRAVEARLAVISYGDAFGLMRRDFMALLAHCRALRAALEPEHLAQRFHEIYERLAPHYGYITRDDSRTSWELVPTRNKQLMVETCRELAAAVLAQGRDAP